MKHPVYVILAVDKNLGVGKDGKMAWHLPEDLQYFHETTKKTFDVLKENMVIMGDTTWKFLPKGLRPMKERKNVVLTRDKEFNPEGTQVAYSLEEALSLADDNIESIFIIGGAYTVKTALEEGIVDAIYLTSIDHEFDVDAYFSGIPVEYEKEILIRESEDKGIKYRFLKYEKF